MPPRPELPESLGPTDLTTSYIIPTGIKISVFLYTSNVEQWVFFHVNVFFYNPFGGLLYNTRFNNCQFLG